MVKQRQEENNNLGLYNKLRLVPDVAKKTIAAGRLKGMTDINPMYRVKVMTEVFGVCGIGWRYEIVKQWNEQHGNEVKAFTNINLYVKVNGEWSEAIPGCGGSTLVEQNQRGIYVNDEGYKMSLTDALSVAMKALGVAADVYYQKDADYGTKYEQRVVQAQPTQTQQTQQPDIVADETLRVYVIPAIEQAQTNDELLRIWNDYTALQGNPRFVSALTARRKEIAA